MISFNLLLTIEQTFVFIFVIEGFWFFLVFFLELFHTYRVPLYISNNKYVDRKVTFQPEKRKK